MRDVIFCLGLSQEKSAFSHMNRAQRAAQEGNAKADP